MSKSKGRNSLVFIGKISEYTDYVYEFFSDKLQTFSHNNDISIVADIAACGSKVDNTRRLRTLDAVCVHMTHYIVSYFLLLLLGNIVIDIVNMSLHLFDHLIGYNGFTIRFKTEFFFGLSKSDPQLSPCGKLLVLRKNELHLLG